MNRTSAHRRRSTLTHQKGFTLMLVLLLIGVALSTVLLSYVTPLAQTINSDKATAAALAQAKDALIGRAATDGNIPGSLPCPDVNNNGQLDLGVDYSGSTCTSYIGRLPWKTLGLPDLRDGSGERLWYALSANFRDNPAVSPLNSDTSGQLTITGSGPASNVIAIIFAPGPVVGTQVRDAANQNIVANYLEDTNASGGTTFITGPVTDPVTGLVTINDRLLAITSDALFPAVEYRVAREIRANLAAYYATPGINYYPFASNYGDLTFSCVPGLRRGRLPKPGLLPGPQYDISAGCPGLADWPVLAQPPAWFTANNWHQLTYYTVAPACTNATLNCTGIGFLQVKGTVAPNDDKRALVIIAGWALAGQFRPCAGVADCLEDAENINLDDTYVKNLISSTFNDKIMIVAP